MNILGITLARGGSKRVPRKNVRILGNIPLLAWTIACANSSSYIDRFVVSSEDDEILQIANVFGAEAIRRPLEMATDEATSYPPLLHALNTLDESFDYLCLLQVTSPFRNPDDVDDCISIAVESGLQAVVSATGNSETNDFIDNSIPPNGAIYVGRVDWLRDGGNFDAPGIGRYYMPAERSLDIDTEEDFFLAEKTVAEWDF